MTAILALAIRFLAWLRSSPTKQRPSMNVVVPAPPQQPDEPPGSLVWFATLHATVTPGRFTQPWPRGES